MTSRRASGIYGGFECLEDTRLDFLQFSFEVKAGCIAVTSAIQSTGKGADIIVVIKSSVFKDFSTNCRDFSRLCHDRGVILVSSPADGPGALPLLLEQRQVDRHRRERILDLVGEAVRQPRQERGPALGVGAVRALGILFHGKSGGIG